MNQVHTSTVRSGPIAGVHAVKIRSNRQFDKHWHDTYGFGLMDEAGQVSASGRGQVRALAGQIITTNPGEVHDGIPIDQHARSWRMIYVTPVCLGEMVGGSDVELTRPVLVDVELRLALTRVFQHWEAAPNAEEKTLHEELLTQACGLLVQRYCSKSLPNQSQASLSRVREALLDQIDCPPALTDIAALAGLSRYQLVRQFSKAYGLPPFAWLQQHRLSRAQALIAGGTTLLDAALSSGFSDQSHLTRAFARYRGFTPGTWQRAQ